MTSPRHRPQLERLERRDLLANLIGHWRADDLNASLADGAVVTLWSDAVADVPAAAVGQPRLVQNALDGHSVVRFNRQDGVDLFNVAADVSPMSGAEDFTIVVALATQTTTLNGGTTAWFLNTGLVDATGFFGTTADWGLVLNASGQVGAGLGQPATSLYSSLAGLNDGQVHVATLTRSGSTLKLAIDAATIDSRTDVSPAARLPLKMTFGALHGGSLAYSGDIAEIQFYDDDLTDAEVRDLSVELLREFSFVPPRAFDDSLSVAEDETLVVDASQGVLVNDLNFEPTPLTAVLVDPPNFGKLSLAVDGSFRYQPNDDYFGEDLFTYRAHNGVDSDLATVTIEVLQQYDPPQPFADAYLIAADAVLEVDAHRGLLANDLNADRSPLQAIVVDDVAEGSLQLSADGSFHYAPRPGFSGSDRFTYRVDDGVGITDPVVVEIRVRSEPLMITELMAANTTTLSTRVRQDTATPFDGDPLFPDWLEITNIADAPLDLGGFHLTDRADWPTQWTFPAGTTLAAGEALVVFASGEDIRTADRDETGRLHTNFRLAADGEYLALLAPDGSSWDAFDPAFPPLVDDVAYGVTEGGSTLGYLEPTPGLPNPVTVQQVATRIAVEHELLPGPGGLQVTAVPAAGADVADIELHFRTLFADTFTLPMGDDGSAGDQLAGDGTYTAIIPAAEYAEGQIVRWFVTLTDARGDLARAPTFLDQTGVKQSPEYFGTVISDPTLTSELPIYQLWIPPENFANADNRAGARGSFSYDGRFYDNIYMRLRGGTTAGLVKKSHRVEFNRGDEFQFSDSHAPVHELNLNAHFEDPLYIRNQLSFETHLAAGLPAPLTFPVRLQRNGQFYQLAFHLEPLDELFLARNGLDGSLYANALLLAHDPIPALGGRHWIEGETIWPQDSDRSDLEALVDGVYPGNTDEARRLYLFDNIDLPAMINYLAVFHIAQQGDGIHANTYVHRDSQTGEWQMLPWDMNHSFGQLYNFDRIVFDEDQNYSHPFFGALGYEATSWSFHRLFDALIETPETREMYLRRLRTLMGDLLGPPGVDPAESFIETRAGELIELIRPTALLDRETYGWPPARGGGYGFSGAVPFEEGVSQLLEEYLPGRRNHLFVNHTDPNYVHASGRTSVNIPAAQIATPLLSFGRLESRPSSGNQDEEFVELVNDNPFAVDISGWSLTGDVAFTLRPGTVVPAGGSLFVSPNVVAFRARTEGPSGGQGLFVQGGYEGRLSNAGGTLELRAADDTLVDNTTFSGDGVRLSDALRISEIHFHPADPTAAEAAAGFLDGNDFEFLELVNVSGETIHLGGVQLTQTDEAGSLQGVAFDFAQGVVTELAAGQRVVVVENLAAFRFRYGDSLPVAGAWSGGLSNNRELLTLQLGEQVVQQFSYDDNWHPTTDGGGPSLESVDPAAVDLAVWGQAAGWLPSAVAHGTPGTGPAGLPPGDLNADGRTNASDIDLLYAEIRGGNAPASRDLSGDGQVDQRDVDELVFAILGTTYGDTNLDGVVDVTHDGTALLSGFGQAAAGWAAGDFSGDGLTTASRDGAVLLAALAADTLGLGPTASSHWTGTSAATADQQAFADWGPADPLASERRSTWR